MKTLGATNGADKYNRIGDVHHCLYRDLVLEISGMIAIGFRRTRESVFWQRGGFTIDAPLHTTKMG